MKQVSLFRSLVSHWVGIVLGVAIGFLLSPYVVHSLGNDLYGVWTLIVSITAQLVVLDLGIRNAVVRYMAMYRAKREIDRASELLSNAALLQGGLGVIGLLILFSISCFWADWFEIPTQYIAAAQIAFLLMSVDAALELVCGVFFAGLAASERYDLLNGVSVARQLLNALLVVVALESGFGVVGVAVVALGTRCFQRFVSAWLAFRENPGLKLKFQLANQSVARKIGSYGLLAAVSVAAIRIIYQIDVVVVGATLGAAAVTVYAIPVILIEQFRMLSQSTATVLTPRLSGLSISDDREMIRLLLLKWAGLGQITALAIGIPLMVTGGDFIVLWMGASFASCKPILQALTFPFFFVLPALGFSSLLYAIDRHGLYARIAVAEAIVNLPLSFALVGYLGLPGVALGTLIPAVLFRGVVLPATSVCHAGIALLEYVNAGFIRFLPLALIHTVLLIVLREWIGAESWLAFIVNNAIGLVVFSFLTYRFWLDDSDRAYIWRRLGSGKH